MEIIRGGDGEGEEISVVIFLFLHMQHYINKWFLQRAYHLILVNNGDFSHILSQQLNFSLTSSTQI